MLNYLSPLHRATRQIAIWFEERITVHGVSPQEGHLLSYLRSYAPCRISEIVRVFGMKHSTMTSTLDRLEKEQLIERVPNPDDRRSFLVRLTRQGRTTANRVQKLVEEIEAEIDKRVSGKELSGFQGVMRAIEETTNVRLRER